MAKSLFPVALAGVAAAGAAIGLALPVEQPSAASQGVFGLCPTGGGINCVVDGDTLWIDGVKVRLADIDTPEVSEPRCASELARGRQATARLYALVNAGPFAVASDGDRDEDRYGRKLRVLSRDGRSLGDVLIAEGLARRWTGRREPWC